MTKQQQSTKSKVELDAEQLARMLAGPPATWVDLNLWIDTHSVSAAYVAAKYRAALENPRVAELPPLPPPSAPAPASEPAPGRGEAALIHYLTVVKPGTHDSQKILARQFGVSLVCVRKACLDNDVRLPETLPRRGKDT